MPALPSVGLHESMGLRIGCAVGRDEDVPVWAVLAPGAL